MTRLSLVSRRSLAILSVMAILSTLSGSLMLAQVPEPPPPDRDDSPVGPLGWGDDGIKEVGVEWVANFTSCPANNLPNCTQPECMKLYNKLVGAGWTGKFHWGNNSAFETDFKRSAAGGFENYYVDNVDLALFCSHGSGAWDTFWSKNLSSLYFGYPHYDCHLTPGEAYHAYGDKDLEWLAFFACSVLSDGGPAPYYNRGYWASTMDGLHLILSMKTTMYCSSQIGEKWADYMLGRKFLWWWIRPPYRIHQAWFEAVDDTQPGGVCARVLAEVQNNYNDHLHGKGYVSPDPVHNSIYWYWDHCSCTPPPLQLDQEVLNQIETLPVYEVKDREVNEQYVLEIASAFDISGTVHTDGEYYFMVDTTGVETYTLQVDTASGGYKYRNQSDLWASPVETPTLPTEGEALRIGDQFFRGPGESLPGAAYHTGDTLIMTEELVEVQMDTLKGGIIMEQELSRIPVNLSLSYGRVIEAGVGVRTTSGKLEPTQVTLSVVGPGARTKMYLGDQGEMLGVQGGSRDVQTTVADVTVIDADEAWNMYLADPTIAMNSIPWVYDVVSKTAETLGYYEQPQFQSQTELIPTWIFSATFYAGGETLAEGVAVYIPAAADYLPPEVSIESPTAGAEFETGELVSFSGSVVQYGKPPFTYEWYSSYDGFLGSGQTITAPLTTEVRTGIISHTISLQVTDANGQEGADSTMVFVKTAIHLPLVLRNWEK
jgi:hypothetical protein